MKLFSKSFFLVGQYLRGRPFLRQLESYQSICECSVAKDRV